MASKITSSKASLGWQLSALVGKTYVVTVFNGNLLLNAMLNVRSESESPIIFMLSLLSHGMLVVFFSSDDRELVVSGPLFIPSENVL